MVIVNQIKINAILKLLNDSKDVAVINCKYEVDKHLNVYFYKERLRDEIRFLTIRNDDTIETTLNAVVLFKVLKIIVQDTEQIKLI